MKLHTDHHFVIGHGHVTSGKPCQDHAISGMLKAHSCAVERAFAVVSDGCSSAGQTDIGSRLVTSSTVKALRMVLPDGAEFQDKHPEAVYEVSGVLANTAANHLGLNSRDLLATQLFAVVEPSGKCFVSVYGDGAVAFVDHEGGICAHIFEWQRNFPFYPHEDRRRFVELHGGVDSPSLTQTAYTISPQGEVTLSLETTLTAGHGCNGVTFFSDVAKDKKTALVCLFSDGVMQVGRVDPKSEIEKIEPLEVVRRLVAFKGLAGEFSKRRMIRFLKECRDIGVGPLDDLGYAVIAVEHEDADH